MGSILRLRFATAHRWPRLRVHIYTGAAAARGAPGWVWTTGPPGVTILAGLILDRMTGGSWRKVSIRLVSPLDVFVPPSYRRYHLPQQRRCTYFWRYRAALRNAARHGICA